MAAELYGRLMLIHVEESVHLPDSFALHFDDPHFELFDQDKFRLGTRVQVAFRAEDDVVVVTSGEVTAISIEPGTTGRHELVVTGLDLTHRLARGPKTRTFLKMSDSDIAAKIAGEYGLDTDIDAVRETHEYVLQAGAAAVAASLLLRAAGGAVILRGEATGNRWLGAGDAVALDRVGRRLAGNSRVTSVEHTYGADKPYTVRFVCGGKEAADMSDL